MTINTKSLIAIMCVIVLKLGLLLFSTFASYFQGQLAFGDIDRSSITLLSLLLSVFILVYLKIYLNKYLEVRNVDWTIYGLIVLTIIDMIFFIPELGFEFFSDFYLIKSRITSILSFVFTLTLAINIIRIEHDELQNYLKFYGYTLIISSSLWLLFPFISVFFGYIIIQTIVALIGFITPVAMLTLYNKTYKTLQQESGF